MHAPLTTILPRPLDNDSTTLSWQPCCHAPLTTNLPHPLAIFSHTQIAVHPSVVCNLVDAVHSSQYCTRCPLYEVLLEWLRWLRDPPGAGQPFTMKMRVRYNAERICYRPAFWQELYVSPPSFTILVFASSYVKMWVTKCWQCISVAMKCVDTRACMSAFVPVHGLTWCGCVHSVPHSKYGWVQYVAVLLPLLWIARYVQWFVFGNQIVESVVEPNAILRVKPHSH